jgi:hypothetical protein
VLQDQPEQPGQPDLLAYRAQPDPLDPRARQGRPDCRVLRDPLVRQGSREFLDPPDPPGHPAPLGLRAHRSRLPYRLPLQQGRALAIYGWSQARAITTSTSTTETASSG